MLINFNEKKEINCPGMNNSTGSIAAKMYMDDSKKIIPTAIHAGGSIGIHRHETSDEIDYVLSGTGRAVCDGLVETL